MAERLTIIDFVDKYTAQYADHVFLREKINDQWTETSFATTRKVGLELAAGLMSLGVEKGEKISLIAEGCNWWILAELGILYSGAVNVPLSTKLEESNDLIFRIVHSESKYVFATPQQASKIRRILPVCPDVKKLIIMATPDKCKEDEMSITELQEMGKAYLKEHEADVIARSKSVQPDDYATISYTSGTTADPKGVLLTHRNYTANVEQAHSVIKIDENDVMLILLPLDHCFAHVAGFYTMMSYGGSIATVPVGKNPLATLKNVPSAIKETRPAAMLSVPALARNFKKNIETAIKKKGPTVEKLYNFALKNAIAYNKEYYNMGGAQFWRKPLMAVFDKLIFKAVRENFGGRMKFFVGGGALLDIELQRFFCAVGMPMFQGYGLSEATPIICSNAPGHARFGSSGRTVKPMDIKICDDEGKEVPYGEKGEIVIRGENVMAGYWKNPESTAKTVIDGWLHTGDMGYICPEDHDFLYVTGRFKSLLISADGEKYSPEGFEDSLVDGSKYIAQCIIHNNQNPYTMAIIVPEKDALKEYVQAKGLDPESIDGKKAMLDKIQEEVNAYKTGGAKGGMFPDRWLPAALAVVPEAFSERNGLVNSTMKVVRGKVEKYFEDRLEYAYTAEGKNLYNEKNIASV
ncbi:MAG: AMP-binding protein [Bacteroidales bacterium]|nr:AMP-binding protein [Bacteroidales bacterium]